MRNLSLRRVSDSRSTTREVDERAIRGCAHKAPLKAGNGWDLGVEGVVREGASLSFVAQAICSSFVSAERGGGRDSEGEVAIGPRNWRGNLNRRTLPPPRNGRMFPNMEGPCAIGTLVGGIRSVDK